MKKKRYVGLGIVSVLMAVLPNLFFVIAYLIGYLEDKGDTDVAKVLTTVGTVVFFTGLAMFLAGPITAIAIAVTQRFSGRQIAFWNMMIKLLLIPIHIILGICVVCSLLFSFIPVPLPFFMIGIPLMIIFWIIDYIVIILTSVFGFAAAGRAAKDHIISGGFAAGMIIMHCFAILDVISCCILFGVIKGREKEAMRKQMERDNRFDREAFNSGYMEYRHNANIRGDIPTNNGYNNNGYNNNGYNNNGYNNGYGNNGYNNNGYNNNGNNGGY